LNESVLRYFSIITVWLRNFWRKKVGAKADHKLLVKSTTDNRFATNGQNNFEAWAGN